MCYVVETFNVGFEVHFITFVLLRDPSIDQLKKVSNRLGDNTSSGERGSTIEASIAKHSMCLSSSSSSVSKDGYVLSLHDFSYVWLGALGVDFHLGGRLIKDGIEREIKCRP